eukprot:TRINITY_DN773_c0_g1_i12.p1 TRINITY_DN773_c0_g1~~TRINITY_DN773_c0_g1_i12.p1  ORF type:complete len:694 (-),score=189.37 TRINITY_DN773_c0_g1_i12:579-2630(-)
MVRFTIDSIQQLMAQPQQIRNIAVVAHVDHGKTTLTDSLIQRAGIIPEGAAGTRLVLDHTEEEKQRGITIKSTAISLFFDLPDSGGAHLINLIDSPGHADFSSEVSAALRVTDGAVVVVDCVEGKCVQTVTVLRQALGEGVVPVLVLNKIDRAFLELQLDAAAAAERFAATVDDINAVLADGTADAGDATAAAAATKEPAGRVLSPAEGTVAFAAAVLGCGFTVGTFARKYAAKFGVDATRLAARLWGGHYYDRAARRWTTSSVGADGRPLETGFVQYVAGPVAEMMRLCMAGAQSAAAQAALLARLDQQGVRLSSEERALTGKAMLRVCMRRWLPLSDALLEMVVRHLPSPPSAQAQRAAALCAGAATEATAGAIRACDAGGPVVVFVSKMVPQPGSRSRFVAFGRVFSGTVRAGTVVQVIGAHGERHSGVRIRAVLLMMGAGAESLESCPAGNVVGLVGVDECLRRSGTLTTVGDGGAIRVLSFRVSPVVRVAVRPVHAGDAGKVAEALRRLGKSDPLVEVVADTETGELVVCGAGELHLEVVLKELEALAGVPLAAAQPAVSYRETVAGTSSSACLAKSANKLNRVAVVAAPLGEALTAELEACASGSSSQVLAAAHLAAAHGWEGSAARRVWAHTGTTVVADATRAVQNIGTCGAPPARPGRGWRARACCAASRCGACG